MNILLTGFEPFGGEVINPSWEVARSLHGQVIGDATVHARCLPTTFVGAPRALEEALAVLKPGLVIALGLASGRSEISIERVSERRATHSMQLDEPVDLLRELEEHSPLEFKVRRAADDNLVLDVDDDEQDHRAA